MCLKLSLLDDNLGCDSNSSSSTSKLPLPTIDPPPHSRNMHSMITRSKVKNFKPRVLMVELYEQESRTIDEDFTSKERKIAVQYEYDALIRNHIWVLVPYLREERRFGISGCFESNGIPTVLWLVGRAD